MSVLTVLLVILLSMVDGATRLWRESERRVDSYREARAALNLIGADLENLYAAPNEAFFRVAVEDTELDALVASPAKGDIGDALFFMTLLAEDSQPISSGSAALAKSDLCAVGYFLAWGRVSTTGTASLNLYRNIVNSDDTFDALKAGTNPLLKDGNPATLPPAGAELVARNIVRFQIEPIQLTNALGDPVRPGQPFTQNNDTPFPDALDILIIAVNEDTADRWGDDQALWKKEIADKTPTYLENARSFSTRVFLPAGTAANAATIQP